MGYIFLTLSAIFFGGVIAAALGVMAYFITEFVERR